MRDQTLSMGRPSSSAQNATLGASTTHTYASLASRNACAGNRLPSAWKPNETILLSTSGSWLAIDCSSPAGVTINRPVSCSAMKPRPAVTTCSSDRGAFNLINLGAGALGADDDGAAAAATTSS